MKRGFTLLELIIVVMIIGVLATLGFASYGRMVEGARGGEARDVMGAMRKMGAAYYIKNQNSLVGIVAADLGLGAGAIPTACAASHYFAYGFAVAGTAITFDADRCAAGGKVPQAPAAVANAVTLTTDYAAGTDAWANVAPY
jgi:prepilin-type N-terminal cleavage/methylation domain-containing protein